MIHYLAFQATYSDIEIALFENDTLIDGFHLEKNKASSHVLLSLEDLLQKHHLSFADNNFIAVNLGPAPFTTLRVVIATVNGLSFASHIPIIGIDGLKSFLQEFYHHEYLTVAMLNAYGHEVYYVICSPEGTILEISCEDIDTFLKQIEKKFPSKKLYLIGNAVLLYKEKIEEIIGKNSVIPDNLPLMCSIKQIGKNAYKTWENTETKKVFHVLPLYLKNGIYKKSIVP